MNLIKILFILSIFFTFASAKGEVSKIFAHKESATASSYSVPRYMMSSQTYRWGQGNNIVIDGFEYNGHRYNYVSESPIIKIRRADNSNASGEPCGLFAAKKNNKYYNKYKLEPTFPVGCDMAKVMGGRIINIGALDLFKNGNDSYDTPKNIERVDFISPNGIVAPSNPSSLAKAGHVVTEKSGNNEIKIAAILSLDANGDPSAFGPLVTVHDENGDAQANRKVDYGDTYIYLDDGSIIGWQKLGFYRNEKNPPQTPKPTLTGNSNEKLGMAFVSLEDLGIGVGQKYYGFAYFGSDVYDSMNLVDYTSFPKNTPWSALHHTDTADPYGGVASYFVDEEIIKISISDANITEGDSGTKHLNFTVTLDKPAPNGGVTVQVQPHNITANEGEDYTRHTSSIYFAKGESSKTIYYLINGDTKVEEDETFKVELHNPQNAILAKSEAIGTILNDDRDGECEEALLSLDIAVSSTNDDAEERESNGRMYRNSSDLEMTQESHKQIVGIRFQNINIPKNATITNAYIQFSVDETSSQATNLTIYGEATDNANSYSSSYHNISNRAKTSSSIVWSPPAWSSKHEQGVNQRTPNLKNIVQEIVNRGGWSSGNAMSFIITGTGKRVAESYDGESDEAPRLHIEYMGCPTEDNGTTTATCYALTDNSDKLYKVTMSPNATPLPIASYVNINQTFNGEGSAYRASNNKFYAFKGVSDDHGPSDLYTIDIDTGVTTKIVDDIITGSSGTVEGAEFYFNPTLNKEILYVISRENNSKLYAFDPDNNWALLAGYPKDTHTDLSSLAINPVNGIAYAIDDYNYNHKKPKVYQLNLETGDTTHITTLQHLADAEGLAFASDGNLYIEDEGRDDLSGKKLYMVNLQTGELTPSAITNSNGDIEGLSCNGTQIAIDNPTVTLDGNSSVLEGDSNTTDLIFAINLSKPAVKDIMLHYEITDINTTVNEDYILDTNLSILIPKDANSSSIVVKVKGDRDVESDESFSLKLVDATNAIVNSSSVIGTIINDDGVLQEPFSCNETLYLSNRTELGTGSGDSGATWLHSFYATGMTYAPIGDGFVSSDGGYNAIGYNVQDNFIYALYGNHLLKIDKNAVVKDLGAVQGLPSTQLYAGEFGRDGYFYVSGNGSPSDIMYRIDINTKKVVNQINLRYSMRGKNEPVMFWDMAVDSSGNYMYAMLVNYSGNSFKNDKIVKIDISSGASAGIMTPIGNSHSDLPSYISLIFTDAEDKIIALAQDGKLYEIMPQSGKVYFTRPFEPLSFYNDGTSCPDANITLPPHPPRLSINDVSKLEGDSGETTFNFTVTADKPFDMSPMSGAMFYYRVVDGDGDEVVPPHEVALSSDHDFEPKEGIGMGISMFSNGISINIPVTVYGDEKIEKDEEFYVEIYSPQLPPMMNPKYIIDKNIGIGTIINDDYSFNIERVNSNNETNQTLKESLYTQITNKDFNYSIVSYNGQDEYNINNTLFKIELLDMYNSDENIILYTGYYYTNEELKSRFDINDSDDLKIQKATREARFKIYYIPDVNSTKISEFNTLQEVYENLENDSSFKKGTNFSRDSFAIRPLYYRIELNDLDENNQTVTYATNYNIQTKELKVVAGYPYILKAYAIKDSNNTIATYYRTVNSKELNVTLDFDETGTTHCADTNTTKIENYNFSNGQLNQEFSHNNVGKYTLHIEDINWTAIDKNLDQNLSGCILNSSSNTAVNGKYGCNIASDEGVNLKDINMTFQAYKFSFINTEIRNPFGKNYVYMGNLDKDSRMGIDIFSNIIAQGYNHNVLTNFTTGCFAKDINISLHTDFNDDKNLSKYGIQSLNDNNKSKISVKSLSETLGVPSSTFLDKNEGNCSIKVRYNLGKEYSQTTNPIKVTFKSFDANSSYLDESKPKVSDINRIKDINSTSIINNQSQIFYFARVSSLVKHYPATNKKSIYTPLFVEVYCRTNTTTQDWCRETMKLNDNGMINNGQKTYRGWYLATQHDSTTEGRVLKLKNITNNSDKITTNYTTSIPPFHSGKIGKIQTIYIGGDLKNKVSATIEIVTDPWLRFNEDNINQNASYSVTMIPVAGMTGVSPNKNTELGYNLMRDKNGTLNGIVEYNGKISW